MRALLRKWYYQLKTTRYYHQLAGKNTEQVFEFIYQERKWGDGETVSGSGSTLLQSEKLRSALPSLLKQYQIASVLDIPCGDLNWMQTMVPHVKEYVGADIVASLVSQNQKRFPQHRFLKLDLTKDALPFCQLVLCRDCMVHLSNDLVQAALSNIHRSGAEYLLATAFPRTDTNEDIITGAWRPINLQKPPFNLSRPLELIHEYDQKFIALWRLPI